MAPGRAIQPSDKDDPDRPLTRREQNFVAHYVETWSWIKAYRLAGYAACAANVAATTGYKIGHRPAVAKAIQTAIKAAGLDPDSVKARLAQHAKINPADFMLFDYVVEKDEHNRSVIDPETNEVKTSKRFVGINWDEVEKRGYLIKSLKYSRQGFPILEFHDSQRALELVGRTQAIFTDVASSDGDGAGKALMSLPADVLAPSFLSVYRDARDRRHMEYLLKGGRGSTKSSFTSLNLICLLVNNPTVHALAMRQVANTLRDSVYSQIVWAIGTLGLTDSFKCITSPLEIEYKPTGQKIYFRGADKPEMIKSIKPVFGHIGILWFEELDQFHGPEAIRKIEQSTLRGGEEAWEFKTYNPPRTAAIWVNKYVQIPKTNQYQHHSTYLDVPAEWLGQTFIDEAAHLKTANPTAYQHEYLGEVVGTGGMVFENVQIRPISDGEINGKVNAFGEVEGGFDHVLHGLDFGYYPDPAHFSKVHYDAARRVLYIFGEHRAWKTNNRAMYDAIKEHGYSDEFSLIADSAEPKSVGDFREYGASVRGAEKGPESVKYSVKWLQGLSAIIIDNERCPYSAEEFLNYEYEQDPDGNFISEFKDKDNHSIDSVRYATNLIWRRRGG